MGSSLKALADLLPMVLAGASGDMNAVAAVQQRQAHFEQKRKEENLRNFGREVFGTGNPQQLTPERIYEAAQRHEVNPQDATQLAMNFMAYKKQQRGDQIPMSVPMPGNRFAQTGVHEADMDQFMAQNPDAVRGQVQQMPAPPVTYGAPQTGGGMPEGVVYQRDSRGGVHPLYKPPAPAQSGPAYASSSMGIFNRNTGELIHAAPEREQGQISPYASSPMGIFNKQTGEVVHPAQQGSGKAGGEKPITAAQMVDDTRSYYSMKAKSLLDPLTGMVIKGKEEEYRSLMQDMTADLQRIHKGETPAYLSDSPMMDSRDKAFMGEIQKLLGASPGS